MLLINKFINLIVEHTQIFEDTSFLPYRRLICTNKNTRGECKCIKDTLIINK